VRLFVAVRPPAAAVAELDDVVRRLRPHGPGLTWTTPAQWHLTLVFLADVPEQRIPELERRLGQAGARRTGLDVEERPYRPHITLARARAKADLRPLVAEVNAFQGGEWIAGEIELVRSRLGKGPDRRAAHETVRVWSLGSRTPTP
jgi:2'-5' RNA ligase